MENDNIFIWIKAAVVAVASAFSAAFGWMGLLFLAWVCCMAMDWISGSAAAASKGKWSSSVARAGAWHKAGMIIVVVVALGKPPVMFLWGRAAFAGATL